MNKTGDGQEQARQAAEAGTRLLTHVQRFNWILLGALVGGAAYFYSWPVARSVLIGGLLANASFFMLRRDMNSFMHNFSQAGMNLQAVKRIEKIRFFVKFYGRLAVLALVLLVLITKVGIDIIGLVVGLSTIMFSVIVVVLSKGSMLYSAQRLRGA